MAASAGVLQWPAERDISSHVSLTEFLEFCKFLRRFFFVEEGMGLVWKSLLDVFGFWGGVFVLFFGV